MSTEKSKTGKTETWKADLKKPESTPGITWGGWAAIVVSIIVYFAATFIAAEIMTIYPALKGWTHQRSVNWLNSNNFAQFFFVLFFEAVTVGLIFAFIKWRKGDIKAIGLKKPEAKDRTIGYVLLGFLVYFPVYLVVIGFISWLTHLNTNQQQSIGFSASASGLQVFLIFLSLCVFVPIAEEIMFRGFLYSGLKKSLPKIWAMGLTCVIFTIPHLFESASGGILWSGGVDIFILSIVLIWLREKTGKLYAGMGLHALKNFVAFAFLFLFNIH